MTARHHFRMAAAISLGSAVMTVFWIATLAVLMHGGSHAGTLLLGALLPVVLVHIAVDCRMAVTAWSLSIDPMEK